MLKPQRSAYVALMVVMDWLALFAAFSIAWAVRDWLGSGLVWFGELLHYPVRGWVRHNHDLPLTYRILLSRNPLVTFKNQLWIFYLVGAAWLFFLNSQQAYNPQIKRSPRQELAICAYSGFLAIAALLVFMFLAKLNGASRLLTLGVLVDGTLLLWWERTVLLPLVQGRGRQPLRHLLVIGSLGAARRFAEILATPPYRSSRLVGYVSDSPAASHLESDPAFMGGVGELASLLDRQVVDEVVLVRSEPESHTLPGDNRRWSEILELCLSRGRTVSLVDDIAPPAGAKIEATMMGTMPMLVLHNTPQNPLSLGVKSAADRVIAAFGLVILAPFLAGIALAVKISSPGPVFFRQQRVGLNGRLFWFYKFRSMVVNAEELLRRNRAEWEQHNKMSGGFWKWEDDPRITRVGRFLRKYSLDELPQLWNVLRGDMSLVGPRPPLPKEVEQLQPWQRRKLSVKGGLTCLWQVSGRNDIDTDEWMRLDLEYIDNWSLWLDMKLLLKTIKVLVRPRGAS